MSRLATSTKARSANGTPLACPRCWSRMAQRPSWSNRARTTRTGPQVEASSDVGVGRIAGLASVVAGEEPSELGEDLDEEVLAAEIGDDALLDLAVFAVGFDDADVFVDGAAGGADFDGSGVHDWLLASLGRGCPEMHRNHYHDRFGRNQGE